MLRPTECCGLSKQLQAALLHLPLARSPLKGAAMEAIHGSLRVGSGMNDESADLLPRLNCPDPASLRVILAKLASLY